MQKIPKRGRPGYPSWIHALIKNQARAPQNRNLVATALVPLIKKLIKEQGELCPEDGTLEKLINAARAEPDPLDNPWSIAASLENGLDPKQTGELFEIWRFSLALDRPLTVRQARWVTYLRYLPKFPVYSFAPDNSPKGQYSAKVSKNLEMLRNSWYYSLLEICSENAKEEHFNSNNADSQFFPPWEHNTALRLDKVYKVALEPEVLEKIQKAGGSLIAPPNSVHSVEQAVWQHVRAEPPRHLEMMGGDDLPDEVLLEDSDLVAAYWLAYLSKGPLWNNLPRGERITRYFEKVRQSREDGGFMPDSGGFLDDSMYSRQLRIRSKTIQWVKTDNIRRLLLEPPLTGSFIEEWEIQSKANLPQIPFNATLLKTVGYEVTEEQMATWRKLHAAELLSAHPGFNSETQVRFICDDEDGDDIKALKEADQKVKSELENKRKERTQEFLDLVQSQGGPPDTYASGTIKDFWTTIRDEWVKRHPRHKKSSSYGPTEWREVKAQYEKLTSTPNGGQS